MAKFATGTSTIRGLKRQTPIRPSRGGSLATIGLLGTVGAIKGSKMVGDFTRRFSPKRPMGGTRKASMISGALGDSPKNRLVNTPMNSMNAFEINRLNIVKGMGHRIKKVK